MMKSWIVLIVLSSSLVTGCAGWAQRGLPFPLSPSLLFTPPDVSSDRKQYCLYPDDARRLAIYFDEIEAFKHAYER